MRPFTVLPLALLLPNRLVNGQASPQASGQANPLLNGSLADGHGMGRAAESDGVLSHFDPSIANWDINDFLLRHYDEEDLRYNGNKYELKDAFDLLSKISKGWRNPDLFDELLRSDRDEDTEDTTTTFATTTTTTLATVTDTVDSGSTNSTSPTEVYSLRREDIAVAIEGNGHLEDMLVTLESLRSSGVNEVVIIQPVITQCSNLPHGCADGILTLISLESVVRNLYDFTTIQIGSYDAYLPSSSYSRRLMALKATKPNILFLNAGQVVPLKRLLQSVAGGMLASEPATINSRNIFVEIPLAPSQIIYRKREELVELVNRNINGRTTKTDEDSEASTQASTQATSYIDLALVNTSKDAVDWSQLLYCNQWPTFPSINQVTPGADEDPFSDSKLIDSCRAATPTPTDRTRCRCDTVLIASRGLMTDARVLPMHSHAGERAVIGRTSPTYCFSSTTDLAYQVWLDPRTRNLINGSVDELTQQEYRQLQYYKNLRSAITKPTDAPARSSAGAQSLAAGGPSSAVAQSSSSVAQSSSPVAQSSSAVAQPSSAVVHSSSAAVQSSSVATSSAVLVSPDNTSAPISTSPTSTSGGTTSTVAESSSSMTGSQPSSAAPPTGA